jgi:hypothetical protein
MSYKTLEIPENFDSHEVKEWVGDDVILDQEFDAEANTFFVLTKGDDDNRRFIRFFIIGTSTECSVDWDESSRWGNNRLFSIMRDKFSH